MHPFFQSSRRRIAAMTAISGLSLLILFFSYSASPQAVLSRWAPLAQAMVAIAAPAQNRAAITGPTQTSPLGWAAFEAYSASSELLESVADGQLRLYRRQLGQGQIIYALVQPGDKVFLETIHADGAMPGSDATGDTIWRDGKQHLQPVSAMVAAAYAQQPGASLIGAMAFGFHGDVRTSDEGTVVSKGEILRVNAGRSALCIQAQGQAQIGLFDAHALKVCQQAFGAGPVLMLAEKIAHPDQSTETEEFLPFNPLQEDFSQIDWRRTVYAGTFPKTIIGIGKRDNGQSYVVLLTSYDASGLDVMHELRAMGCSEAIGGDDDSSTQLVWRGSMTVMRPVRAVPDAIGIYLRN